MKTMIQKWGDSLILRIPHSFAEKTGLRSGTFVDISLCNGKLVIAQVSGPKPALEQLLAGITEDNLHREVDTGGIVGNEVW